MNKENKLEIAYLVGVKAGLEALISGCKTVAENNGNNLPIEFIELVAKSTIDDVESKLKSTEFGQGYLDFISK